LTFNVLKSTPLLESESEDLHLGEISFGLLIVMFTRHRLSFIITAVFV